jgi:hypothetical protein
LEALVAETGLPGRIIALTIGLLKQGSLLTELERGESWAYQPARPLEETSLREVLEIIRNSAGLRRDVSGADLRKLDGVMVEANQALDQHLGTVNLKDLLMLKD